MTNQSPSSSRRWYSLFFLFHYLFSFVLLSLPTYAGNAEAPGPKLDKMGQQALLFPAISEQPSSGEIEENQTLRDQMAQFWGSAQHSSASDAARDSAGSAFDRKLTSEVENWLTRGNAKARVTLDTGISGRHNQNVGLDYLYPFIDWKNGTLFSQFNVHRLNERNQFNIGLGYRHELNDRWVAGSNIFYDHDLSRHHSRLGLGGELWGEKIRTSVNYYQPLSNWRLSHDNDLNEDFQHFVLYERPASGWDLTLETAINQNVSIKGTYFQWYGDKVDVTGTRSQANRNPRGATLGASWQPIPLLNLNTEHSAISGQKNDTRLGLNLNWQFGRTLAQMLAPENAQVLPSLKDARHDFVHRNNNIVLAYQQREKNQKLYFDPQSLTTRAGNQPFTHTVKGGRGGYIIYHSSQPDVAQVVNQQGGMIAPLTRGEVIISAEEYQDSTLTKLYNRAEYRLSIQPGDFAPAVTDVRISGEPSISNTLTGSYTFVTNEGADEAESVQRWYHADAPSTLLSTTNHYQLTAADTNKTLVYEVTPVNKAGLQGTPGAAQQYGPQLSLKSLSISGVTGGGELLPDGRIKFTTGSSGTLFLEARVVDKKGSPVPDQPVYWSNSNPTLGQLEHTRQMTNSNGESLVRFSKITIGGEGIILASLQPDTAKGSAQTFTDNAMMSDSEIRKSLPVAITFSTATNIKFITPPSQVRVGTDASFQVLVTDQDNVPLQEVPLEITSNGKTTTYLTHNDGLAIFTLTAPSSIVPAQWRIVATLPGSMERDEAVLELMADEAGARVVALKATPTTAIAGTKVTLTATVQDQHGNPVQDAEVEFLSAGNDGTLMAKLATNTQGEVSWPEYVQTTAGEYQPAARVTGSNALTTKVNFSEDAADAQVTELTASPATTKAGTTVLLTATVKDRHGNLVKNGQARVSFLGSKTGSALAGDPVATNADGKAMYHYAQQLAGNYYPAARVGNGTTVDTIVTFTPGSVSTLELKRNFSGDLLADGSTKVSWTAKVTDAYNNPVSGATLAWEVRGPFGTLPPVKDDVTNDKGEGRLTVTMPATQGAMKVTVSSETGKNDDSVTLLPVLKLHSLNADNDNPLIGSGVDLVAKVTNLAGDALEGILVDFTNNKKESMTEELGVKTDAHGVAKAALKIVSGKEPGAAGHYTVTATLQSNRAEKLATAVNWQADTVSAKVTGLTAMPVTAIAGTKIALTATVQDQYGNPVQDAEVAFFSAAVGGRLLTKLTTDAQGVVSYPDYFETVANDYYPIARVAEGLARETKTTFTADINSANVSTLSALPASTEVATKVTLTARVQDQYNNSVPQAKVEFLSTAQSGKVLATLPANEHGEVTWSDYMQTVAGDFYPAARVSGGETVETKVTFRGRPSIISVEVSPGSSVKVNNKLTASYSGFDAQGTGTDSSTWQWYWRAAGDSKWTISRLPDAQQKVFTPDATYAGLEVQVGVTPRGSMPGAVGDEKFSKPITVYGKPFITSVKVAPDGNVPINNLLTAHYEGFDAQGTGNDASTYQWYRRKVGASGGWSIANRPDAKSQTFTPPTTYVGFEIRVGVKPKGSNQSETGDEKYSEPVMAYAIPTLSSLAISPNGSVVHDVKLTATYNYSANGAGTDVSEFKWYWRLPGKSWQPAGRPDADQKSFTPDSSYAGYEVRVGVKPKGSKVDISGPEQYSDPVMIRLPSPIVTNVYISGDPTVTNTLTAHYTYQANGGNPESRTLFQWYLDGSVIPGATEKSYKVLRNNPGKIITVKVTPKNTSGMTGDGVVSPPTATVKPVQLPMPDLTGADCSYFHPDKGIIRWKIANAPADLKVTISSWKLEVPYWVTVPASAEKNDGMPKSKFSISMADDYGNNTAKNTVTFENNFWESTCYSNIESQSGGTSTWLD